MNTSFASDMARGFLSGRYRLGVPADTDPRWLEWFQHIGGNGEIAVEFRRQLRESYVDVRDHWTAMSTITSKGVKPRFEDFGILLTWEEPLPLPSKAAIGLYGWWQIEDTVAAMVSVPVSSIDGSNFYESETRTPGIVTAATINFLTLNEVGQVIMWPFGCHLFTTESGDYAALIHLSQVDTTSLMKYSGREIFGGVTGTVLLINSMAQADPTIVTVSQTPPRLLKAAAKRGKPHPDKVTTIDLPGLRYDRGTWRSDRKDAHGKAWHMVRGHWRSLTSEKFTHKGGQRVWVRPHHRGNAELGLVSHNYRIEAQ